MGAAFALLLLCCVLIFLAHPAFTDLRAAGILLRLENPQHPGEIATLTSHPIEEIPTEVPTSAGLVRARLYIPQGVAHAPGIVVVHGVHHLGIDEPRLVAFARSLSASGLRVLTPELAALADYRVESGTIAIIGDSARDLSTSLGEKVGVLGISFGGGLSLLAAADPQFAPYIRYVVSIGAHDDLERVLQFFITNQIARPDGATEHMQAHEYGPLIVIYSHVEDFFPPADVNTAREALKLLLWEKVDESRKVAEQLSPASQQKMQLLYNHHIDALASKISASIASHQSEISAVSPHGHLQSLHVPVLLLHGAEDNVIPPTELLWLEKDIPAGDLKAALISPALSHVSMESKPTTIDNLRLVHFMAEMLDLANKPQPISTGEQPIKENP
jgi:dienelactone hydrolase